MQHNKHIKHINISIHKIHKIDAFYMSFKINEYINTLMLPRTEKRNKLNNIIISYSNLIKHMNHINYAIYIINMITINIIFCNTMRKI